LNTLNILSICRYSLSPRSGIRTSSHRNAHIFKASHSTPVNASTVPKLISQNRFPVNRSAFRYFRGAHILPTVSKEQIKFLDKSKSVIRGHVLSISSYESASPTNILSNTTVVNSPKLLPSTFDPSITTIGTGGGIGRGGRLLFLDFIESDHFDLFAA